jgi:hypothetical protein
MACIPPCADGMKTGCALYKLLKKNKLNYPGRGETHIEAEQEMSRLLHPDDACSVNGFALREGFLQAMTSRND